MIDRPMEHTVGDEITMETCNLVVTSQGRTEAGQGVLVHLRQVTTH